HKQAAKLVIPKLLKSLRNEKIASVRCALLKALGHIAEANPNAATITIQSLKDPDNTVRCAAVAALGQLHGPKDARITAIAKVMTDPSQEIRMQAIKSIRAIGANTPNALLQIQTALKDKDEHVRYEAIQSLTDLCNTPGKTNARESLTPILTNNDRHDFGAISEVIETSGSKAKWAVSILMKMLVDKKHTDIRYSIAHTLTYIGPAAIDAAPKLNKLLLQSDEYFYTAAKVLGSIGAANAAATGKIISVFNDVKRSKSIRIAAAGAILGIAPSDAKVTRQAADFLTHIVKTNRQWYKAKEFKTPRDREIARSMANQAKKYLMSQKPLSRPAASLLQDQLQDIVNEVRSIAGFYPYPSLAVDYAAKLVRSDDRTLAHTGIAVLIWIMKTGYVDYDLKKLAASDPTFWKINPFLKRIMKYPSLYDVHLRKHAIETLGRLGPSAKQAVPHLQEMTKWKDLRLRPIARKALNNIQAKPQQKKSNSANG
ncbi:MAG: hypothetical protein HN350_19480, partial [Phycisphaerales bacterium]|nr:hypothetical protein [Phycisphaerales bacterium]